MSASATPSARAEPESALPTVAMLLGGRYRLWERLAEQDGSTEWRATDEVLARTVAVRTFPPESQQAREVIAAARAAARVSDARLARVLDADECAVPPYVVTEWPSGTRLGKLVAAGPVAPWRAASMIAHAAQALAAAHEAGLAHLSLTPDSLWCDAQGQVKITGLGIAAALTGAGAADPARADTDGLARLLYAALTGYWPGRDYPALPSAPRPGGRLRAPAQIRLGIPASVGTVTCRALPGEACGAQPPILGPAQLAMELDAITRSGTQITPGSGPRAKPEPAPATTPTQRVTVTATEPIVPPPRATLPLPSVPAATPARHWPRTLLLVVVVLGLLAGTGWLLARELTGPTHQGPAAVLPKATAGRLVPVSASAFGPGGASDGDNPQLARFAIHGGAAAQAAWHTDWYTTARFGDLKPGTGLLLDMGRPVTITGAQVTLGGIPGADLELRVGAAPALADLRPVADAANAYRVVRLDLTRPARGRYVVIWFTRLPADSSGTFQATISDVILW